MQFSFLVIFSMCSCLFCSSWCVLLWWIRLSIFWQLVFLLVSCWCSVCLVIFNCWVIQVMFGQWFCSIFSSVMMCWWQLFILWVMWVLKVLLLSVSEVWNMVELVVVILVLSNFLGRVKVMFVLVKYIGIWKYFLYVCMLLFFFGRCRWISFSLFSSRLWNIVQVVDVRMLV